MKFSLVCTLTLTSLGLEPTSGFSILSLINKVHPSIKTYAESQHSQLLKIHLDIGKVDPSTQTPQNPAGRAPSRLGIDNLLIELDGTHPAQYSHPKLPGCDGPNPQLSSGAKSLSVLRKGQFVDLTGTRQVTFANGAWELIWRENAPAGALICGFDVPSDIQRNAHRSSDSSSADAAAIPKGRVYLTFPIWTSHSLRDLRDRKAKAEERALEAMQREKDELYKMQSTNNLIMKALHFRNACKANEDLDYSGHRIYSSMPLDRDMIPLPVDSFKVVEGGPVENEEDGLYLCSLGTVWTKQDGLPLLGGFGGGDHVLLGSASAVAGKREDVEGKEKREVSERELKRVAYDGLRP